MKTTLEAAARQAAARLYAAADFLDAVHCHPHSTWNCRATIDDCRVAADTLREALAEQATKPDWKSEATALRVNEQNLEARLAAEPVSMPALVGVLATLPAHIKEAVEAYGAACARVALLATHSAPTQQAAEPVAFLANGTRFKMSFFENEDGPGTHVTCFEAFEKELDGRWVALVAAEDDCHLKLTQPAPTRQPLTPREVELIDGMIEVQMHHAAQCDAIANRTMADKQKKWDMERVELLRKLKAAHGITSKEGGAA